MYITSERTQVSVNYSCRTFQNNQQPSTAEISSSSNPEKIIYVEIRLQKMARGSSVSLLSIIEKKNQLKSTSSLIPSSHITHLNSSFILPLPSLVMVKREFWNPIQSINKLTSIHF
jgi:hypothetical protein